MLPQYNILQILKYNHVHIQNMYFTLLNHDEYLIRFNSIFVNVRMYTHMIG